MKQLMLGLIAACLLIAFQNCSNGASFQSTGDLVVKAGGDSDLGAGAPGDVNTGDGDPAASPTPPPTATPPTATPPPNATPPPTATPPYRPPGYRPPGNLPPGHSDDDDCDDDDSSDDDSSDDNSSDDDDKNERHYSGRKKSALQYVCVLEGPGKSLKVGIISGSFVGQNGTPNDVCMTQNACLNILSKKFDVKSAEKRGFCPNKNKHVVPMTDAEIEASLARTELMKLNGQ